MSKASPPRSFFDSAQKQEFHAETKDFLETQEKVNINFDDELSQVIGPKAYQPIVQDEAPVSSESYQKVEKVVPIIFEQQA